MEEITLILVGISVLIWALSLAYKDAGRSVGFAGTIVSVCAIGSLLTEEWTDYTLFVLLPLFYIFGMSFVGACFDNEKCE